METETLAASSICVISASPMKSLRSLHLFLGCLFAPMLIFFAVTGSWQLFNWHESKKDKTAIGLITNTIIGIIMAYRFSNRPLVATICLLAGIALPGLLLWIYR